jgi:two-component system sensor histidine kinase KdpD
MMNTKPRGRLRIYLGYATGSGKSFYLLRDAVSAQQRGQKIAIAALEHMNRAGICNFVPAFPLLQPEGEPFNVDQVIASDFDTIIIDELAYSNPPGSKNKKRYEDVIEILDSGKSVFTTLNIQHVDSVAERLVTALNFKINERVPDQVLNRSDAIVFVDISIFELQARIESGQIFAKDKAEQALFHFFTHENLCLLRKLTLELLAEDQLSKIESERILGAKAREEANPAVLVVITDDFPLEPLFEKMIHKGAKLASNYRSHCHVVSVRSSHFLKMKKTISGADHQAKMKALAESLGATHLEMEGPGLSQKIVQYCGEHSIKHLVFAKEQSSNFIQKVIHHTHGIDVHLIDRPTPKGEQ